VDWSARGLVTVLFTPWVALLALGPKLLLAIVLLDIPLEIDKNFGYLEAQGNLGALGGFDVSLTTIALIGLYAGWLLQFLLERRRAMNGPSVLRLALPLSVYVLCILASIVAAEDLGLYARDIFLTLQMFLLFLYLVTWTRTPQEVIFIVSMLLAGLILESLIILGMGPLEMAGVHVRVLAADDSIGARFSGTLGSPVDAGAYLSLLLAPAVGVLASRVKRSAKLLAVVGLCLGSVALVGTLSRAAWGVAILSIAATWWMLSRRGRLPVIVPCLIVASVLVVGLVFQGTIITRLTGDDDGSARGRVPLMMTALDIIHDHPILGVGANNYVAALNRYESSFTGDWLYTVHNKYLLVWAETGIAGLAAFLWFFLSTIRRGWEAWRRCDSLLSPIALGFTAALAARMLHMFVDIFNDRPETQLVWVIAALIMAMTRIERRRSA
jgi:O-antigen ligase